MSDDEFTLEDLGIPARRDLVGESLSGCLLEREVGRGAMGTVYRARRGEQPFVVKVLAPEIASNPQLRSRFQREWEALARLSPPHPNVVQVFAVAGEDPPHIVMEWIEGLPLDGLLQRRGRIPAAEAVRIALDAARGLTVVHGLGLVHRDVKPANLMLTPDGRTKLVDFGVAKDVFRSSLTQAGQVLGTAHYMSPEQWGDAPVDGRSDVFGLGATLYHLLVGEPPFAGGDVHEMADLARNGDYPPPAERVPDLPRELELLLARMLEPQLRYRYPTMGDVVADLERVQSGGECSVPSLLPGGGDRIPLVGAARFTVGRGAACAIVIDHPSVSTKHAQLRREEEGFTLRDLRSEQGTLVDGQPVPRGGVGLVDGATIRVGEVELVFRESAGSQEPVSTVLADVRREERPDPLVRALSRLGDPSVVLEQLEASRPDPVRDRWRSDRLARLLGGEIAREVAAACRRREEAQRAVLPARLVALTGASPGEDPAQWLAWWAQVRTSAPPQVTAAGRPRRDLRLRSSGSVSGELALAPVVLVGRDPRCAVRVDGSGIARLHVTILRLHRRVVARAEGPGVCLDGAALRGAELFEPGQALTLGGARLELVLAGMETPSQRGPFHPIGPDAFEALTWLGHPSVAQASVALLRESQPAWIQAEAAAAFPNDPRRSAQLVAIAAGLYTERARHARQALARICGRDAGADPRAWEPLLASHSLGPQLAPWGWLAATR